MDEICVCPQNTLGSQDKTAGTKPWASTWQFCTNHNAPRLLRAVSLATESKPIVLRISFTPNHFPSYCWLRRYYFNHRRRKFLANGSPAFNSLRSSAFRAGTLGQSIAASEGKQTVQCQCQLALHIGRYGLLLRELQKPLVSYTDLIWSCPGNHLKLRKLSRLQTQLNRAKKLQQSRTAKGASKLSFQGASLRRTSKNIKGP